MKPSPRLLAAMALALFAAQANAQQMPQPQGQAFYEKACKRTNMFNEAVDWGLPPAKEFDFRLSRFRKTPTTVAGATTITACQAEQMAASPRPPVFVFTSEVREPMRNFPPLPLPPNTLWLPNIGRMMLPDGMEIYMLQHVLALAKSKNYPVVVFSGSALNTESVNLALKLSKLGFTKIYWMRGGLDAWNNAVPQRPRREIPFSAPLDAFASPEAIQQANQSLTGRQQ